MSSVVDFQIPEGEETLSCDPTRTNLTENEINCELEECRKQLMLKGGDRLHHFFPLLKYIVRRRSQISTSVCEFCWKIIAHELELHIDTLSKRDILRLNQNEKKTLKISTKILCYVAVNLAKMFEEETIRMSSKEKKGKKAALGAFSWQVERLKLTESLMLLSSLELMQLWETPSPSMMEDLSNLIASLCYKLLENPVVGRDKILLDQLADIIGLTVKKYGITLGVSLKLVQLLQHFDHLATAISHIVATAATKYHCEQLALNMFREICSMDPSGLSMDSSGTKSFASFLVIVSGQTPTAILPAVPVLLPHLSGESTAFRTGVLGVLGELLKSFSVSDEESDLVPDARKEMVLKVIEHLHDVNAFVRVKALHVLLNLCSSQMIPLHLLQGLLERVAERLRDKSSLVRKATLQLLSAMLSNNPFAAQLDRKELTRKLEEEGSVLENASCDEETVKHMAVVQYLQAALDFTTLMCQCIPTAVEMLQSKVVTDVLESLEFLCVAHLFGVDGAVGAISKSLHLVWAQDERLCKAVVSTYVRLYLTCDKPQQVVENLLKITSTANSGELASMEKLVELLVQSGHIPAPAIKELWQIYRLSHPGRGKTEAVLACQLLAVIVPASAPESSWLPNLGHIMSLGFVKLNDLLLAKHACSAVIKMSSSEPGLRLPNNHRLFIQTLSLLTRNFTSLETNQWIPLCEQSLNLAYQLSEQPNVYAESLLKDLSQRFKLDDGVSSIVLSRLLFCAGHVAQCQVLHCELHIVQERKKVRMLNPDDPGSTGKGELEDDLGIGAGDDQDADFVRKILETEVGGSGMLTAFEPLIVSVVSNPSKYACNHLQTAAATALSKFMLISSTLCNKYLQLFFTVLEKATYSTVRANLIIAASDLVCRFPNTIEPWTPFLYSRLKDDCGQVRKNAIMILTHLILNDMIKIRGQISAMALSLEDDDSSIKELSQVFFYELSLKGNSLYNILPDIISQLTDPDTDMCSQASFRTIIRHLFQYIKKEKHQESLIEKLCYRLRAVRTDQQAHSLAYCLSLFSPTEKGLNKLQENFLCFKDKLSDEVIFKSIQSYLNRAKKIGKAEVKIQCEEFEKQLFEVLQDSQDTCDDNC